MFSSRIVSFSYRNMIKEICLDFLAGFEVFTVVVMKRCAFWDITPDNPLEVSRRFGATYDLHLQGRKISRARKKQIASLVLLTSCCFMMMEPVCSFETPVNFQRNRWRFIPENIFLSRKLSVTTVIHENRHPNFLYSAMCSSYESESLAGKVSF